MAVAVEKKEQKEANFFLNKRAAQPMCINMNVDFLYVT